MSSRGRGRGRGRGGQGRSGPMPRAVQVSKQFSWLLRHGATKEGILLNESGYAKVSDVLSWKRMRDLGVSFEELQELVQSNDKQRFHLLCIDESTKTLPEAWLIRASQGHSIPTITSTALALTPVTAENAPQMIVHGTYYSAWPLILQSGGLKPMTRGHVHFAAGLPEKVRVAAAKAAKRKVGTGATGGDDVERGDEAAEEGGEEIVNDAGREEVISGWRLSSQLLIYINVSKALEREDLKWWRSANGVILSEGNEQGLVPLDVFERVVDRKGALGIIWENGQALKEVPTKGSKGNKGGEKAK